MKHGSQLAMDRCPHCNVARPSLNLQWQNGTKNFAGINPRFWSIYACATCGGMVMACSPNDQQHDVTDTWPSAQTVADVVPDRAREFLAQAIASLHAPAGAVMLAASSVDAMLKEKGYKDGSLYDRIDKAAQAHLITEEMAAWAHEVRLDANDQRHADEGAALPGEADATKVIEFTKALAQFLYVLPARVARGRLAATP